MATSTGRRRPAPIGRPLATLVAPALGKTLAARGFAAAEIVTAWPEIVGDRLAAVSEPIALRWPAGDSVSLAAREAPATLVIRAEGAFGLELQHLAPVILERVNAYFGWRCAGKLTIRQGQRREIQAKSAPPRADSMAIEKANALASGVADEPLRKALARLGSMVLTPRRGTGM